MNTIQHSDIDIEKEFCPPPGVKERLTFPKSERLHHRTLVEGLFKGRNNLYEYPLRLTWRALGEDELRSSFRGDIPAGIAPLQMMVTVPKKKRRHAVDRVLMRRRIREAYRLRRRVLRRAVESVPSLRTLSVGIIYMASENVEMSVIETKMEILLSRLMKRITVG
ncbi:MAG: ribonuclease P protein component [Muribaculaceae bacterium]|nr:ribonuclease P protein component [Muribaculaceae bacterium]